MAETVGFIGLGTMGGPMAENLTRAGFPLVVYDVVPEAMDGVVSAGAVRASSPADLARRARVVVTMLPDSPDVERVVAGPEGIAEGLAPGSIVVDMSTISAAVARRMAALLEERGSAFFDAPVSGGVTGARAGTLSIMVGGPAERLPEIRPLLEAMGKTITHVGGPGAGQAIKACNQVAVALHIQAVCEAFALARAEGLDLETVRQVLSAGAAGSWMFENLAPQMISGDASAGFRIKLQLKDLRLALEAAFERAVPLPGASLVTQLYVEASAHGEQDNGNQALYRVYERLSGG